MSDPRGKEALDHTASMSPDERARRGLTPPAPPSGERHAAGAIDTPAVSDTLMAPDSARSSRPGAAVLPVSIDISSLPVDDTGRYELSGVHARGGLGRIVKARDQRLHRTVAIKELLQRTPSTEARFVREALITARLEHPGIVPVHEAGRWPSGDPYYSMKLVSGRTLKELIQSRESLNERVPLVPNVLAVAEAIAYAHSQRIIHRDIKPANVIVGDFGETVVVDWGLAKDLSGDVPEAHEPVAAAETSTVGATAVGNIMGTPSYMSPEQARGEDLDERADVYSLGAMLYELLVGEPPHTGNNAAQILDSALAGLPQPIERYQPDAPADLVAIARKAMARRRDDRYPSAVEVAEDLRRFQSGQLVTARSYSTRTLIRRWIGRHRGIVAVAAAAGLALLATGAYSFTRVVGERNLARDGWAQAETNASEANRQKHELVFLQAQSALTRDPTAALAWLKDYPPSGRHVDQLPALVDEATALGVSRHVFRRPSWVMGADYASDGSIISVDLAGAIMRWDPATGAGREIGRHSESVWMSRLSPDRTVLAVGGQGGRVGIFPLGGPGPMLELPGFAEDCHQLDFSADGARLMTSSMSHNLRVFDVASGKTLLTLTDAGGGIHPDGKTAFVGLASGVIERITLDGGARRALVELDSPTIHIYVSPRGDKLVAHGKDGTIRLVDIATGKARELGVQPVEKAAAVWSRSGELVATGGIDALVHVWSVDGSMHETLRGHDDAIYQLVFAPDGSFLATASDDGTARIWNLRTWQAQVLRGHDDDVFSIAIRPDGAEVVTSSLDSSVRVWPVDVGARVLSDAADDIDHLHFSSDGKMVENLGKDRVVRIWDLASGERREQKVPIPLSHNKFQLSVALDKDFRRMALARDDGTIELWNLSTNRMQTLSGHQGKTHVAMSRDGKRLVSRDKGGTIRVWELSVDLETAPIGRVLLRDVPAEAGGLSDDGTMLVLYREGKLSMIDVATGRETASMNVTSEGPIYWLMISPNNRYVLGINKRDASIVWDIKRGNLETIGRPGYSVYSAEFSPDGTRVAAPMNDRTVLLLDLESGRRHTLDGHRDLVYHVAFSPDGATLASASYDRTVRLWDGATGDALQVLRGHTAAVHRVVFSPDGRTLASAADDRTVRLWEMSALPSPDPAAVRQRIAQATSARIENNRVVTPPAAD